jgi:L,D-transpeptidase-like protein
MVGTLVGVARSRIGRLVVAAVLVVSAGGFTGPRTTTVHADETQPTGAVGVARSSTGGYWVAASYGDVVALGGAPSLGGAKGPLNAAIVGIAATPSGNGYWLVASDGGVWPFGDAGGFGSLGNVTLNQPVVGIAASPGGGYWLVAADGGVFPFGDAAGYGSTGGIHLNKPVVGMASAPDGSGYWLVASDGGIFPFGPGARGYGSAGGIALNRPITGMAVAPGGNGYWLVASDGGIFPFGPGAGGYGSEGGTPLNAPIVGMAPSADAGGYWLVAEDGGIFPHGDAPGLGSAVGKIRWNAGDVVSNPACGVPVSAITPGKVILISLACQQLTAYQDGVTMFNTVVTTGRPALPTPPGEYSVLYKISPFQFVSDWPPSSPYWYPPSWTQYTLWFKYGGYAIHDAPWRSVYGPGTEANGSHGCVNVPMPIMASIYAWAPVGTAVRIF